MAKGRIPGPLERRHLVEREIGESQALAIAEAYLETGRAPDAVDFLARAHAGERLAELRREAVSCGDAFLLRAVARAMETPPGREEWSRLAEAADAAGKTRYADEARRQAERGED